VSSVQCVSLLASVLSSLVGAAPPAHAQAQTAAEIAGQVLDPSKAAIPDASVTATSSATGAVRKARTDSQGYYALTNLPAGTYSITVEHEGFQQLKQTGVILNVAANLTLNSTLMLGSVKQQAAAMSGRRPFTPDTGCSEVWLLMQRGRTGG
jgi:Carboxypeptidase regulatory-like domain